MVRRPQKPNPRKPSSAARDRLEGLGASSPQAHRPIWQVPPREKKKKYAPPRRARRHGGLVRRSIGAAWRLLRFSLGFVLLIAAIGFVGVAGLGFYYYQQVATELPDVSELRNYKPSLVTRVFGHDGTLIREFYVERRFLVKLEEVPDIVIQAILATEDARFEEHPGIDMIGILRAALRNVIGGGVVQGGSTITQQLAKTLFLTPRRSLDRKIREAILAIRIERTFSKREILNLYLNQIYFGNGAYGVEAASRVYFGKNARDLTLSEAALLAGLPRAPSKYSPYKSYSRALRRRAHVLRRLIDEGYITPDEWAHAESQPIRLAKQFEESGESGYAIEYVRRRLEGLFGSSRLYRGGLKVYTTINHEMQRQATRAVRKGIIAVDKRRGYRGAIGSVDLRWPDERIWHAVSRIMGDRERRQEVRTGKWVPAVVFRVDRKSASLRIKNGTAVLRLRDAEWARPFEPRRNGRGERLDSLRKILRRGDVILVEPIGREEKPGRTRKASVTFENLPVALAQEPEVQAAAVVTDLKTGAIRAMVGGYDYERSQFNRAYQAIRPPGSAFKPVTYSAAISEGWTPSDIVMDAPIIFPSGGPSGYWKPTNFENRFFGPTTLREALARSRNVVTVKLANSIGVRKVVSRARELGIRSPLENNLSIALGSSGVSLLELTSMYGALANQGSLVDSHIINRVENSAGAVIWRSSKGMKQAVPPEEAYLLISLLKNVTEWGTARKAQRLKRPVAGKTGTTNDYQDAWFMGVTPLYAAGVWVGMDDKTTLGNGETGSKAALPIWMDIAEKIHEGLPPVDFERPEKIEMVSIDPKTGVRVSPETPGSVVQAFISGTEPSGTQEIRTNQGGLANAGPDGVGEESGKNSDLGPGENSEGSNVMPPPIRPRTVPERDPFRASPSGS